MGKLGLRTAPTGWRLEVSWQRGRKENNGCRAQISSLTSQNTIRVIGKYFCCCWNLCGQLPPLSCPKNGAWTQVGRAQEPLVCPVSISLGQGSDPFTVFPPSFLSFRTWTTWESGEEYFFNQIKKTKSNGKVYNENLNSSQKASCYPCLRILLNSYKLQFVECLALYYLFPIHHLSPFSQYLYVEGNDFLIL